MHLNVRERADSIATFRWIEVRLMEMLAAWVPTTPEMEVKLVFGAHIWDVAQHADMLGKRTHELRLPLQHSREPEARYVRLLADVAATTGTDRRIAAFYDLLVPALDRRYGEYLGRVDTLLDGPSLRIIERIQHDHTRMLADARALRDELPVLRLAEQKWLEGLREREAGLREIVVYRGDEAAGAA